MWLTHPGCDGWEQVGEHTSHCTVCHRTFTSLRGFDYHHTVVERSVARDGVICANPAEMTRKDGGPRFGTCLVGSVQQIQWQLVQAAARSSHWT